MKNFLKIEIVVRSEEEADIYIANLAEINFYGFEQNEKFLTAYIAEGEFNEKKFKAILPDNVAYSLMIIENKNWNEEWERGFQPVRIDNLVGIRASFHAPLQNIKHDIIITPKMSFGTGHHATTHLMIEQMEQINFKNKSVLDFGTGTGILAILAEKLGAAEVTAIDNDEWSINNAIENIAINNSRNIKVQYQDSLDDINGQDIILANINLNVLRANAQNISLMFKHKSLLLLSGFFVEDEVTLLNTYRSFGFVQKKEKQLKGWSSLLLCKG